MGRNMQHILITLLFIAAVAALVEDTCPEVRIVGLSNSDKLAVLQGCPGLAGAAGPKGEPGASGLRGVQGKQGIPGKAGPEGQKGDRGVAGPAGLKGDKGSPGAPGAIGEKEIDNVLCEKGAKNCKELLARGNVLSGWYTIYLQNCSTTMVLCDMDTDGGGWIVFQKRADGSEDFFRDWASYKRGFGSQVSEFWLGNDNIHLLTSLGNSELRIDLKDFENNKQFAKYKSFKIAGEREKYKLILGDFLGGTAGGPEMLAPRNRVFWGIAAYFNPCDSLTPHNNMLFSTKDNDNDLGSNARNCAKDFKGAWWYKDCHWSNLNGMYLAGAHASFADGVNWRTGKGYNYSYKWSEMKFRPV